MFVNFQFDSENQWVVGDSNENFLLKINYKHSCNFYVTYCLYVRNTPMWVDCTKFAVCHKFNTDVVLLNYESTNAQLYKPIQIY